MTTPGLRPRRVPPAAGIAAPADKRFRRSDTRPSHRRLGRTVMIFMKWAAPAVVVLALLAWLGSVVTQSRFLAVQHVVVNGNVHLSSGEIETLVDGLRGESIFRVDFETYRRRVMDSPWVSDVSLSRELPSTVVIRVKERTPLAVARLGHQLYLVDDAGVIIDEYSAEYRSFDLPIVDGLLSSPAEAGPLADTARVRLTDVLLTSLGTQDELRRRVSQVDVSDAHDAVVMFDNDTAWLHLGDRQFTERLHTYLDLAPTLRERFHDIDYVDLRFDERVFVHSRADTTGVVRDGQ